MRKKGGRTDDAIFAFDDVLHAPAPMFTEEDAARIASDTLNDSIARYGIRQPDTSIAVGSGSQIGGSTYKSTAAKQQVSTGVNAGGTQTFTINTCRSPATTAR